jgi:hypothetical protein
MWAHKIEKGICWIEVSLSHSANVPVRNIVGSNSRNSFLTPSANISGHRRDNFPPVPRY